MQLTLKEVTTEEQMNQVRGLYDAAFPKEERKPFSLILQKRDEGVTEILAIEDETGTFYGLVITILYKDIVLLDYFAIAEARRGGGVGSEILQLMQKRCEGKRLLLEIEDTTQLPGAEEPEVSVNSVRTERAERQLSPEDQQKIRRKAFYLRNRMRPMDYRVELFGVDMEILTYPAPVAYEEYHEIFETVYPGAKFVKRIS